MVPKRKLSKPQTLKKNSMDNFYQAKIREIIPKYKNE